MNFNLTSEQWGDLVTLGVLTIMWAVMLVLEIKRTWKWDALGRALTILTFCLLLSFGIATTGVVTTTPSALPCRPPNTLWPPEVRWATRAIMAISGTITIVVLALDRQPSNGTWNPDKTDRRSGKDRRADE